MNEFELINRYFRHRTATARGVVLGVGDDCAILEVPEGQQLAVSIDTMVADVHFPANGDPALIGERALRTALSDLGAMGATPLWFTLALTTPRADERWLSAFSDGLLNAAGLYNCRLVGGDTTRGPLTITTQVHGSVYPGRAIQRQGARAGDFIYVTGDLGDGAAALAMIRGELEVGKAAFAYLTDRFYRPKPHLHTGQMLANTATAAIDISDGLLADLGHICEASGVGAAVDLTRLPVSEVVMAKASEEQREHWALAGGDDYQLCFTVPRSHVGLVENWIEAKKLDATLIGKIIKSGGVRCFKNGRPYTPPAQGYQHFGNNQ